MRLRLCELLIIGVLIIFGTIGLASVSVADDQALSHARQLLESTILIDGHNDLPWTIREHGGDVEAYDLRQKTAGNTDLVKLREGKVGAQFWSVWIPADIGHQGFAKVQLEQIDIVRRMIAKYPDDLVLALSADDIEAAANQGRIASLIGMEGGHAIENSIGALRAFFALGVRYLTLTHNKTLDWVDSATDTPRHNGLSEFGREVVREMNRLGMLVDISHVSAKVMSDVLDISEAPVIFSHSSARAITDHVRNVPDRILSRLAANGGLVMVTFIPLFVSQELADWAAPIQEHLINGGDSEESRKIVQDYAAENPVSQATLSQVADHIDHIRKVAGIDHVGIGSDYWGGGDMPLGLEDTSRFPYLFAELVRRGWNDADLKKLAGKNLLRVMRKAEHAAVKAKSTRPASTLLFQ